MGVMMLNKIITFAVLVFILGWVSHLLYTDVALASAEPLAQPVLEGLPSEITSEPIPAGFQPTYEGREKASPADRLKQSDIHVTSNRVVIDGIGREFETAVFTNTNSMDPLIDENTQAIQIVPRSAKEIMVGDIVSYDSGKYGIIIHRVINIGEDENGWYAIVKGDNNPSPDPFRVRFSQIKRVLVGVLY